MTNTGNSKLPGPGRCMRKDGLVWLERGAGLSNKGIRATIAMRQPGGAQPMGEGRDNEEALEAADALEALDALDAGFLALVAPSEPRKPRQSATKRMLRAAGRDEWRAAFAVGRGRTDATTMPSRYACSDCWPSHASVAAGGC